MSNVMGSQGRHLLTAAMEDYLKAIYLLQQKQSNVSTSAVADYLGFSAASVTGMVKKLATLKMVDYVPYRGVQLTASGERAALETLRHHRLLELFLTETMGFAWDEVHEEADRLEHVISERLEARIFEMLGEPTHDPHGDPIPTLSGELPDLALRPLTDLPPGESGIVARVATQDDELLRYLSRLGIVLNVEVAVTDRAPFDGPVTVRLEGEQPVALGSEIARRVLVLQVADPDATPGP